MIENYGLINSKQLVNIFFDLEFVHIFRVTLISSLTKYKSKRLKSHPLRLVFKLTFKPQLDYLEMTKLKPEYKPCESMS